ncbi:MAG: error-prone polymerase, partial [Rhodospirillales bacterium]|nr:error-prone polymerase [Rhodospirillales bacterium]
RAHHAAKQVGIRLVIGARLDFGSEPSVLCYPTDRAAYGRLSKLITLGRRRAPKGECHLDMADLIAAAEGQVLVALPPAKLDAHFSETLTRLKRAAPGRCYLAAQMLHRAGDARRLHELARLAERHGTPLIATNDVLYHAPERRALMDVIACIREHVTIDSAGRLLESNAERHLKSPEEMARLFRDHPEAVARTAEVVEACRFSLDELAYEYPDETTGDGRTPQQELEFLAWLGAQARYPDGVPPAVAQAIRHELTLIGQLRYAPYFLTVHDIVRFARSKGILCQGRGSAANSSVCYCLGITAVDPTKSDLLFERFVSAARNEPPDIDVDFEHERREEVIQYIYEKYGRDRAGLAATVICYRARSAVREVGKAMGLSLDAVARLAESVWGWSNDGVDEARARELGFDAADPRLKQTLELTQALIGFPRHLSQHVGGFVITRGPLEEVVPIENAAMEERTVVEWDKDDLDELRILKIDVLGLGMLTAIRKAFELIERHWGKRYDLATIPPEDPAVYDMLCKADSIGVFQVESRAQMSMLPRLKPRSFYDLVIEVAIVRPGPIQGDMVHPYLRRRSGEEPVVFPSPELRQVLGKTLGVPLFQEQAMKIAIVAAGFTPSEADGLRRAMATFKKVGEIHTYRDKMISGMLERGYEPDFAERCFSQIEGFGTYGFPESHAASFALLVYVSAWIKCHYPAAFAAALLNSQPMGFYAPAQIVRDAGDHGVELRGVDVNASDWDCTLEPARAGGGFALRIGFRQVKGMPEAAARRLVERRGNGYPDPLALWRRGGIPPVALERLAEADALRSMGLTRREALWALKGLGPAPLPLFAAAGEEELGEEPKVAIPEPTLGEEVLDDYRSLRLTLKAHPMKLLRDDPAMANVVTAAGLKEHPEGRVTVAGLVLVRQRPGTASGVIFATIEDETGVSNLIIWPRTFETFRREVLASSLMRVEGKLQREGLVMHVIADRIDDLSHLLRELGARDGKVQLQVGRGDQVRHGGGGRPDAGRVAPTRYTGNRDETFPSRDFR